MQGASLAIMRHQGEDPAHLLAETALEAKAGPTSLSIIAASLRELMGP